MLTTDLEKGPVGKTAPATQALCRALGSEDIILHPCSMPEASCLGGDMIKWRREARFPSKFSMMPVPKLLTTPLCGHILTCKMSFKVVRHPSRRGVLHSCEAQALCLLTFPSVSCVQLCCTVDCSPPGSSVHGILQARTLEWVAMPSSRVFSGPRDQTQVSRVAGGFFTI